MNNKNSIDKVYVVLKEWQEWGSHEDIDRTIHYVEAHKIARGGNYEEN